jgi:hypothetical protein
MKGGNAIKSITPNLEFSFQVFQLLSNQQYTIKVLSPTDAQENCFKRSIKIYIKTAATCFGVITIIRERTISAC